MTSKRKSCPVKERLLIEFEHFDINDKSTFHGTEPVRELNKFDKRWFRENDVAITMTSKSLYGATFVVPYVDILGIRYWIISKEKRAKRLLKEKEAKLKK